MNLEALRRLDQEDQLRDFREQLTQILDKDCKDEVYQFCFQAFPLTNLEVENGGD